VEDVEESLKNVGVCVCVGVCVRGFNEIRSHYKKVFISPPY